MFSRITFIWLLLSLVASATAMECGAPFTPIFKIQSDQRFSPLQGQQLETEGVVTRLAEFGFWIQTPDHQQDNNPKTSEGLFIHEAKSKYSIKHLSPGKLIRVAGKVKEKRQVTQLSDIREILTCGSVTLPVPQQIQLPLTLKKSWEKYEGMRVELVSGNASGSGNSNNSVAVVSGFNGRGNGYTRHNEVVISNQIHFQPTHIAAPGSRKAKGLHKLWLQDQLLLAGLSTHKIMRMGDQFQRLSGVVHSYAKKDKKGRVWPRLYIDDYQLTASKRPIPPVYDKQTELVVASFNLNNYFNGERTRYGTSFKHSRGAKNIAEFKQQSRRIEQTILAINADILVLNEVENDGYQSDSALQFLISRLNQQQDKRRFYRAVNAGYMGTDSIRSAIIYRPDVVIPVGEAKVLSKKNSALDGQGKALFDDYGNRPVIIQEFFHQDTRLTIAAVHLKSKGSSCKETKQQRNGSGNCNMKRSRAAMAIAEKLLDFQESDIQLVLGDFNAYQKEQPLQVFNRQGWSNAADLNATQNFSYRFRGRLGSLDHIIYKTRRREGLKPQYFFSWPINSVESDRVRIAQKDKKAQMNIAPYLRSSDHDPQVLTLSF